MTSALPATIRLKDVIQQTGLSKPTIYRRIKAGTFPAGVVPQNLDFAYWFQSDIDEWRRVNIVEPLQQAQKAKASS